MWLLYTNKQNTGTAHTLYLNMSWPQKRVPEPYRLGSRGPLKVHHTWCHSLPGNGGATWWRTTHGSFLWVSSPQWFTWDFWSGFIHFNHWGELTHIRAVGSSPPSTLLGITHGKLDHPLLLGGDWNMTGWFLHWMWVRQLGWWHSLCYIGNVIIPTDELTFFRGVETTNQ